MVIGGGDTGTGRSAPPCVTAQELVHWKSCPAPAGTRRRQSLAGMAQGLSARLCQEEAAAKFVATPASISPPPKSSPATSMAGSGSPDRPNPMGAQRKGPIRAQGSPGTSRCAPSSSCFWLWASSARNSLSSTLECRARRTHQYQSDTRSIPPAKRRLCCRRLPTWPKPGGLGLQRGPRRRPRVRPLPHGQH